ncbi:MAG: acyl-CoA thioesterase [Polyangiaceae bacterium]|nr:acyl-CoA thioesterase [Polyangiaceae bacterium]
MGIVHHSNYLQYFEAARVEWLKARGVSYDDWVRAGIHLPVVDARLRYQRPARFDDALVVAARVAEVTRVTVRFSYEITREADGVAVCDGETRLACVGQDMRPRRWPAEVARLLGS